MRFFPAFMNQKAAQVLPEPRTNPARALMVSTFNWVRGIVADYANVIAADKAAEHPVIFRCLNKIGLTVQAVKWYVEVDDDATKGEQTASGNAKFIKTLTKTLNRPSAGMTGAQLRYWYAVSWANYGEASFKVIMDNGSVIGIYPLAKENLKITFDKFGDEQTFEYGKSGGKDIMPSLSAVDKDDQGVPTKSFAFRIRKLPVSGSLDPAKNNTPLQAAGKPSKLYDQLLDRALDTSDNQPNTRWMVTADPETTSDQAEEVKEAVDDMKPNNGDRSSSGGTVLFVAGRNIKITELKNDLSDIHTKIPFDDMARLIAGLFGIPVALLGLNSADGSKFASNYAESRLTFFEDVIEPDYLTPCEEGMTIALCRAGYRIRFDRDSIPAIKRARAEVAKIYNDVEFIDDNEKREVTGWPKRETPRNVANDQTTGA